MIRCCVEIVARGAAFSVQFLNEQGFDAAPMRRKEYTFVARWIRLFEKKRGERRTGSSFLGRIGETAFFGALFLLGAVVLSNVVFQEVMHPSAAPRTIGLGFWLMILVLSSFVLIGGGGVLWAVFHSRTSVERRSAIAKKASNIDILSDAVPMPRDYPTLPTDANLTNSPGMVLAYRLPTVESTIWGMFASAVFCLAWNGMSAVLAVYATHSWTSGRPEWFLSFLLLPFFLVGGWAVYYFLHQLVIHTGMGPTIVEISSHPLFPGGRYELLLSLAGNLRLKSMELHLVCEEEATFHQGTDVRHETRAVFRLQLFRQSNFRIEPGMPYEQPLEFSIPAEAMHSFQSSHNAVNWKLVVSGVAEGWPGFQRSFPIIVYPERQEIVTHAPARPLERNLPLTRSIMRVGA